VGPNACGPQPIFFLGGGHGPRGPRGSALMVLEYCAFVWHYALTKAQTQQLKAIQKRAIQTILNFPRGMPYSSMLFAADLTTLASRRDDISRKFIRNITKSRILLACTIFYQNQRWNHIILG